MWLKRLATTVVLASALVLNGVLAEAQTEWPIFHSNEQRPRISFLGNRIYHSNGEVAWDSFQNRVYYPNGQLAWNSFFGNRVYYANGKVAWNGFFRSCYALNGRIQESNCNGITVNLGPSISLTVTTEEAYLNVEGTIYPLTNSNSSLPSLTPIRPLFKK